MLSLVGTLNHIAYRARHQWFSYQKNSADRIQDAMIFLGRGVILFTFGGPVLNFGRICVLTSMRRDAPHVMFGHGLRNG